MSRSSKLTQQIQRILREKGEVLEPTGPTLEGLIAARKRNETKGSKAGRKFLGPRLVIKSGAIKIKYDGERIKTTGVVLQPGMIAADAELAADVALDDFKQELAARDRDEISCEDVELRTINLKWINDHASKASPVLNRTRRLWVDQLEGDFPASRLGDVLWDSGNVYINKVLEGVVDDGKRKTLHNSAVEKLYLQLTAIEYYYNNLTYPPDRRKSYEIPTRFKRKSEIFLTYDQLMDLLKAAEGWRRDERTREWIWDPDPNLFVVRRYILIYFYSGTRDKTILPLKWGMDLESGSINAEQGIIYRKANGTTSTHKRATPAYLLGDLKDEVKKWEREDMEKGWIHVLHDATGGEITRMKSRFDEVKRRAGLPWTRAHDLKHTGVTFLTHAGLDIRVLATTMSTLPTTLENEYEHLQFIWMKPKTTTSVDLDLSLAALEKTSPKSSEKWMENTNRAIAARIALAEATKAKRASEKSVGSENPIGKSQSHSTWSVVTGLGPEA